MDSEKKIHFKYKKNNFDVVFFKFDSFFLKKNYFK